MNSETRNCQNCKNEFIISSNDFSFYQRIEVPLPTFCPLCRLQRRLAYVNERSLYKNNCAKCGKSVISMYHKKSGRIPYCDACYYNDSFDPISYGIKYDPNVPFFIQLKNLINSVPTYAIYGLTNTDDCGYANYVFHSKDTYLSYNVVRSETIYYSKFVFKKNRECFDCFSIRENEKGYELMESSECYNCDYLKSCSTCIDSSYLYDCINCNSCFMSSNLRNKSYVFRNVQLDKEEFFKKIKEELLTSSKSREKLEIKYRKLIKASLHNYAHIISSSESTGDHIEHSKNVLNSFHIFEGENLANVIFGISPSNDCQDMFSSGKMSFSYDTIDSGKESAFVKFSFGILLDQNVEYSFDVHKSENIFGCVGLTNEKYCILNTRYNKEEYFKLREEIINDMKLNPYIDKKGRIYKYGEFLPIELSPFAYNETLAFEELKLSQEKIKEMEYKWYDTEDKSYVPTILSKDLPDNIEDVRDVILNEIIHCPNDGDPNSQCSKAYRIMPNELIFYKSKKIPLPRFCPNCRYHKRLELKNPWRLWNRTCMCDKSNHFHTGVCSEKFETSYSPDGGEIVYCKKCYQQEIY
jgi:hypothetical protein